MSKHTPGPWAIDDHLGAANIHVGTVSENGRDVCRISPNKAFSVPRSKRPRFCCDDEDMSNAALIAAAPDLLAALKAAEPHLYMATDGIRQAVRAAIAKAEGAS